MALQKKPQPTPTSAAPMNPETSLSKDPSLGLTSASDSLIQELKHELSEKLKKEFGLQDTNSITE